MGPALLAVFLIAYNNLANRWRPFNGIAYVPMNLTATAGVLLVGFGAFGLEPSEMGLRWSGAWIGVIAGAAAAVALASMLAGRRTRRLLADRRLDDVSGWSAVYMVCVRIPLGTAVLEEVAFRGVLLGALMSEGTTTAIAVSSISFGFWHVVPTSALVRANRPGAHRLPIVLAGVVVTAVAGVALGFLRVETGAIAAPLLAHALIDSSAATAAIVALRRPPR